MKILVPQSLEALLELLEERKDRYFFRGQSPQNRELNSTLVRELLGETTKFPRHYIPKEHLSTWTSGQMRAYVQEIFGAFTLGEDVTLPLNGKGDQIYTLMRYVQQNPAQEKILNALPQHPTPTIEFSESYKIALYFSSIKATEVGALFCLEKLAISTAASFVDAFQAMTQKEIDITPCVIKPPVNLNDLNDQKPKKQKAIYIFQRDLRHPINHYLAIEKIVIDKALHPAIQALLKKRGITEDFVYARI